MIFTILLPHIWEASLDVSLSLAVYVCDLFGGKENKRKRHELGKPDLNRCTSYTIILMNTEQKKNTHITCQKWAPYSSNNSGNNNKCTRLAYDRWNIFWYPFSKQFTFIINMIMAMTNILYQIHRPSEKAAECQRYREREQE